MIPSRYSGDDPCVLYVEFAALVDVCGLAGCTGVHPPRAFAGGFFARLSQGDVRVVVVVDSHAGLAVAQAHFMQWVTSEWLGIGLAVGVLTVGFVLRESVPVGACVVRSTTGLSVFEPALWW